MTPEQIREAFERVLAGLGLDPVECREGDGWWRFTPHGLNFQGGIHRRDFRIVCTLVELDGGADLDEVYAQIEERNAALPDGSLARFGEADNYLHVQSKAPFPTLTPEAMATMIESCAAVARSDAAAALKSRFRAW